MICGIRIVQHWLTAVPDPLVDGGIEAATMLVQMCFTITQPERSTIGYCLCHS